MHTAEASVIENVVIGVNLSSMLFIQNFLNKRPSLNSPIYWVEENRPEDSNNWECVGSTYSRFKELAIKSFPASQIDLLLNSKKRVPLNEAYEQKLYDSSILDKLINLCLDNNAAPSLWKQKLPNYNWKKELSHKRKIKQTNFDLMILNKRTLIDSFIAQNHEKIHYTGESVSVEKIIEVDDNKKQIILNAPNKALFAKNTFQSNINENYYSQWNTYFYKIEKKYLSGLAPLTLALNDRESQDHSFLETGLIESSEIFKIYCFDNKKNHYNLIIKVLGKKDSLKDFPANPIKVLYKSNPFLQNIHPNPQLMKSYDDKVYANKELQKDHLSQFYQSPNQLYS